MTTNELILREDDTLDLAPRMVMSTQQALTRLTEFHEFVSKVMVDGTDYGKLPGIAKPTLLKPGAEKLCEIYGLTPEIEVTNRVEDWHGGFFHYECKCKLVNRRSMQTQAEGVGSCNSKEDKYRWRNLKPKCPNCGAEAIAKSKKEWGGGWYCNKKDGGCAAKFDERDPAITSQPTGKTENTEPFTLVNTILKMAKKRALIDATLSATRSSGMFTQDVEDWIDGEAVERPASPPPAKPAPRPTVLQPETAGEQVARADAGPKYVWPEIERFANAGAFYSWCSTHFHVTQSAVNRELNINSPSQLADLEQAATTIRSVYGRQPEEKPLFEEEPA